MFSEELNRLIEAALADGVLTDKERAVIRKRALSEGVDPDEVEIIMEGRLYEKTHKNQLNYIKCPVCGLEIPPLTEVCPNCGSIVSLDSNQELKSIAMELNGYLAKLKAKDFDDLPKLLSRIEELKKNINTFYGDDQNVKKLLMGIESEISSIPKIKLWAYSSGKRFGKIFGNLFYSIFEIIGDIIRYLIKGLINPESGCLVIFIISIIIALLGYVHSSQEEREAPQRRIVEEQYLELTHKIDSLGIPTLENYENVKREILSLRWKELDVFDIKDYEEKYKEQFEIKKRNYIQLMDSVFQKKFNKTDEELKNITY